MAVAVLGQVRGWTEQVALAEAWVQENVPVGGGHPGGGMSYRRGRLRGCKSDTAGTWDRKELEGKPESRGRTSIRTLCGCATD